MAPQLEPGLKWRGFMRYSACCSERLEHGEQVFVSEAWGVEEVVEGGEPGLAHADSGVEAQGAASGDRVGTLDPIPADEDGHGIEPRAELGHELAGVLLVTGSGVGRAEIPPMRVPVQGNGPLFVVERVLVPLDLPVKLEGFTADEGEDVIANLVGVLAGTCF